MESLLCVKIASMGDLLLAAPAFRRLRVANPGARLTLAVGASCEEVARHLPFFDRVEVVDDRRLMAGGLAGALFGALGLWRLMRSGGEGGVRPSSVLIFHRDWRYALVARLAGVPRRHGFDQGLARWFLTHSHVAGAAEHHVFQYLGLCGFGAAETGTLSLAGAWFFSTGERERGLEAAAALGLQPERRPLVGLAFGGGRNVKTRTALKAWPVGHFRKLADELVRRGCQVAWLGDAEDAAALGEEAVGVHLAGCLTLSESAAVVGACSVVVANDSFLLHLAGALGVPSVGLFGPTDPAHYRPLDSRSTHLWIGGALPCSPCHRDGWFPVCRHDHRCMRDLEVGQVLREVEARVGVMTQVIRLKTEG